MANSIIPPLRVLAWESTCACTLACPHCRASAVTSRSADELSTNEACKMLSSAAELGKALVIISGGEPLLRPDLEEVARHALSLGHKPVVSCNDGRLLTDKRLSSLYEAGIRHFSFSMHSCVKEEHDAFVRVNGAFEAALGAFNKIKAHNMSFQINTTVLPSNSGKLEQIKNWVVSLGARAWHLFFVVPTGRASMGGKEIKLPQSEITKALNYLADNSDNWPIKIKVTCAPQYARIRAEKGLNKGGSHAPSRSCMAGSGYIFVSYKGDVKPCGYFDLSLGNIKQTPLAKIYNESKELEEMRTPQKFTGVCKVCRFNTVCGGCRARAYAVYGSYLASDPNCEFNKG